MNREEAHQFIKLYVKFLEQAGEEVKITDICPAGGEVELQFLDGSGRRRWYNYWYAAKAIEAVSCSVPEEA